MKSSNNKPTISIVIPTLNNGRDIENLFKNIWLQDYPKNKMDIVISDGGSTDDTIKIAKRYTPKIVKNTQTLAEPGVTLGINNSKGDLLMILAADNRLLKNDSISSIVKVFENPNVFAAFPKHDSVAKDTLFSKYINTFTDPFNHFIYGNASNGRTFKNIYKTIISNDKYDVYDYSSNVIRPILAFAQGFTFRSGYKRDQEDEFDDVVPIQKMINENKKIAYVHSVSLTHHTIRDMSHFIRKTKWATQNAVNKKEYGINHREKYLSSFQKMKIIFWPIYALFLPFSIVRSIIMYILSREKMWLFSPIISFISALSSVLAIVELKQNKSLIMKRQ